MKNNKKENLKNMIEDFLVDRLTKMKEKKEENIFEEEIGEIEEFKNLSDVEKIELIEEEVSELLKEPVMEFDFSQEEVHKLEIDLDEMEEHIKEVAEDIKLIDDTLIIKCKINDVERLLVDGTNCNIKPIMLLNIALITPLNLRIFDLTLNSDMESIMSIKLYLMVEVEKGKSIYVASDVKTLYDLGLLTAVDSLFTEVELCPIEFRGINSPVRMEEFEQIIKFSANIE